MNYLTQRAERESEIIQALAQILALVSAEWREGVSMAESAAAYQKLTAIMENTWWNGEQAQIKRSAAIAERYSVEAAEAVRKNEL